MGFEDLVLYVKFEAAFGVALPEESYKDWDGTIGELHRILLN